MFYAENKNWSLFEGYCDVADDPCDLAEEQKQMICCMMMDQLIRASGR